MFPHIFVARVNPDGTPGKYDLLLCIKPKEQQSEVMKSLMALISSTAKAAFPGVPLSQLSMPVRKGQEFVDKGTGGVEAGDIMVAARSKTKVGVVDINNLDIIDSSEVFAGQIARAEVAVADFNVNGKRGVTLFLNNVQILKKDMPRLDGRLSASASFATAPKVEGFEEEAVVASKAKGKPAAPAGEAQDDLFA
jgi:hypothetical protein